MGVLAINGGPKTVPDGVTRPWPVFGRRDLDGLYGVLERTAPDRDVPEAPHVGNRAEAARSVNMPGVAPDRDVPEASQSRKTPEIARFEKRFAEYNDVRYCILCANGTVSIELILRALGVGRGDEVIIPPFTFIATASSVIFTGAMPVFADVEPETCILSAESARKKITPRTKAIMPVYVGGRPADLDAFADLAREAGIYLIGDAAQAAGSQWKGRGIGSYGIAASFSCQNSKNLTCGEGGIITTDDGELAGNIRSLLNIGADKNGGYSDIGAGYNISEWQASMLNTQMDSLDGQTAVRMENAAYLDSLLEPLPYVSPLAADSRITRNSCHIYAFRILEDKLNGVSRDTFIDAVRAEGVDLAGCYMPLYDFPCLRDPYAEKIIGGKIDVSPETPAAERLSRHEAAWLFQSALLNDRRVIKSIADAIKKVCENLDELRRMEAI